MSLFVLLLFYAIEFQSVDKELTKFPAIIMCIYKFTNFCSTDLFESTCVLSRGCGLMVQDVVYSDEGLPTLQ